MPKKRKMNKRGQIAADHVENTTLKYAVSAFLASFVMTAAMLFLPVLRFFSLAVIVLGIILIITTLFRDDKHWAVLSGLLAMLLFNIAFLLPGATYTFWSSLILNLATVVLAYFALGDHDERLWHWILLITTILLLIFQVFMAYLIINGGLIAQ